MKLTDAHKIIYEQPLIDSTFKIGKEKHKRLKEENERKITNRYYKTKEEKRYKIERERKRK